MSEQHLFDPPPPDPNYKPPPTPQDPLWRVEFRKETAIDVVIQAPTFEAAKEMAGEMVEDDDNWDYVEWDYDSTVYRTAIKPEHVADNDAVFVGGPENGEWTDGKTWKKGR